MKFHLAMLFFAIGCTTTTADEVDVFDLSLEELMEIRVVTASRVDESLRAAPIPISVISARDLQGWGYQSLPEALEQVVGVLRVADEYRLQTGFVSRGDYAISAGHWLLLIDGMPFRSHANLTTRIELSAGLLAMPLQSVERIEVVRGPASILYGSQAYTAVINVITKVEERGNAVLATRDQEQGHIGLSHTFRAIDARWRVSLQRDQAFSDQRSRVNGLNGEWLVYAPSEQSDSATLSAQWVNTSAQFIANRVTLDTLSSTTGFEQDDVEKNVNFFALTQRLPTPSGEWLFHASRYRAHSTYTLGDMQNGDDRIEVVWSQRFNDRWHWFATAETRREQARFRGNGVFDSDRNGRSLSSRLRVTPSDTWNITGGVALNDDGMGNRSHNPLLAMQWQWGDSDVIKGSYARAIRTPDPIEYDLPLSLLIINPDLAPESSRGVDWQWLHSQPDWQLITSVWRTEQRDGIRAVPVSSTQYQYRNVTSVRLQGLDVEWKYSVNAQQQWGVNISLIEPLSTYATATPHTIVRLQWRYALSDHWRWSNALQWHDEFDYLNNDEGEFGHGGKWSSVLWWDPSVAARGLSNASFWLRYSDDTWGSVVTPAVSLNGSSHQIVSGARVQLGAEWRF